MNYQGALMVVYKPAQCTLLQRLIGFMQQLSRAGDNVLVDLGKTLLFLRLCVFCSLCSPLQNDATNAHTSYPLIS